MLTQVWAACKRGVRAVNVFKKKNCGASPLNGENYCEFWCDIVDGKFVFSRYDPRSLKEV